MPLRLSFHASMRSPLASILQIGVLASLKVAATPAIAQCLPTHQAQLLAADGAASDTFGYAIALDEDTVIVGAHNDDTPAGENAGSAHIFVRSGSGWTPQGQLFASDPGANDAFGWSVSISGDTAVVGTFRNNAVYVFVRTAGTWTQQARLAGAVNSDFGYAVAVDGETVVVGTPGEDTQIWEDLGAIYIFVRQGSVWTQQAHLLAVDGNEYREFGRAVALSGNTALAASMSDNTPVSISAGAAHVFIRDAGVWSLQTRLYAADGASGDRFGSAMAIRGNTAAVGASLDDTPGGLNSGSAYVFVRDGSAWTQQGHLLPSGGAPADYFGTSIDVSGNRVLVGAFFDDTPAGADAGSVYAYTRTSGVWSESAHVFASGAAGNDYFGASLALDGTTAVVGAYVDDTPGGMNAGSVAVLNYPGGRGDVNCDCVLDFFDIDPFLLALLDAPGYIAAHPVCDLVLADVNEDGVLDFFDIDPFLAALFGA